MLPVLNNRELDFSRDQLFDFLKADGIHLSDEELQKARHNNGRALYDIGDKYFKKNFYNKAHPWFRRASFEKFSNAQNKIVFVYHYGKGVPRDYNKAIDWYLKAVDNDDFSSAQNNIGLLYRNGQGVPQNYEAAIGWYKKSADQNNEVAQYNLGLLFEFEPDVKDLQQSVNWYQKALNGGYRSAKRGLEVLKKRGYHPITEDINNTT